MKLSTILYIIVALIVIILGAIFIQMPAPVISISAEKLFSIGPLTVTNSLVSAWIGTILIFLLFFSGYSKYAVEAGWAAKLFRVHG